MRRWPICKGCRRRCTECRRGKSDYDKGEARFEQPDKENDFRKTNGAYYDARIEPFLDYLASGKLPGAKGGQKAGASKSGPLGDVLVVNAMSVGPVPEDETIHVFLGDLHLPIISEKDETYIPSMKGRGGMVPRAGRFDLGTDAMERFVVAMFTNSLPGALLPSRTGSLLPSAEAGIFLLVSIAPRRRVGLGLMRVGTLGALVVLLFSVS